MEFDEKKEYEHGIAAARKDGKWGYIDSKGNVKIPFIYEYAHNFDGCGYARVDFQGREVVIDMKGKIVFQNRVGRNQVYPFHINGQMLFVVSCGSKNNESWGIVDNNEQVVISVTHSYEQIETIKDSCRLIEEVFLTQKE